MFKEIFLFELKQWLKRPAIYIYFLVFFALSFLIGASASGLISGGVNDTNTYINSAFVMSQLFAAFVSNFLLGLITLLICVAIIAGCIQKDFQYNTFSFYFTKPISKFNYVVGRYSASLLLIFLVSTGLIFGILFAYGLSSNENGQFGAFRFMNYFQPFMLFIVPNVFFVGTLFFSLVTYTRNMTSGYIGCLLLIILANLASSMTANLDNKTLAALLDPFGGESLNIVAEYWTPAEINTRLIPFSGAVMINRLLYMSITIAIFLLTYYKFSFSQFLNPTTIFSRKKKTTTSQPSKIITSISQLPKVVQQFDLSFTFKQYQFLTKFELSKLTKSVFFYIVIVLSILLTAVSSNFSGMLYGTQTFPVTYQLIELSGGAFNFFQMIMVVFYCAIVIWRERDAKVDELIGASPISNSTLFLSKFTALVLMCLIVNLFAIITSVSIQAYNNYFNFEIGLYLKKIILFKVFGTTVIVLLGLSLQTFIKNRYVGFFVMALILLAIPMIFNAIDYSNSLISFNSSGDTLKYSDMNADGHTLNNFFIHKGYWIAFTTLLATLAIAMYQRGKENTFMPRLKKAVKNYSTPLKVTAAIALLGFFSCGSLIYYNERVLNKFKSEKDQEKEAVDYEKKYKKYEKEPQPRIVESIVNVDIFPDEQSANVKGHYYLKNKNKVALNKIVIFFNPELIKNSFSLEAKHKLDEAEKEGFYCYNLTQPMQPGDSIKFNFDIAYRPKKYIMNTNQTQVVYNGTFFNNRLFPSIGYNADGELAENAKRKRYQLPPKSRIASIDDTAAYANTYISNDADWIRFESIVSTKEGQTAIAPGYLQKEWQLNGRHYYHYKMDSPILNFYAFLSASYQVKKEVWQNPYDVNKPVAIEIYHQPGHDYNIDRMIKGIKKSLDYFWKNFSPYQHKQVRILEFPRYATFAQSFPNTIPFSEAIGFIAKVNDTDPTEVDYPFYVTAHEVAHQWWAHQVIGANVQGCTVMSETMAQYSALMVMKKEYGQEAMTKFMRYEMDKYLQNRTQEAKKEVPILKCENQQYIHYRKGSVVMYALQDYLGEDTLNAALAKYIKKVAYQSAPYTTAKEFYSFIKAATPDSLKETVKDLFERIVIYDNTVKEWKATKQPNGKYLVNATVEVIKTQSDSLGKGKEVAPNNWFDITAFAKNDKNKSQQGKILYNKKIKITSKLQKIEFTVDSEPYFLGIDSFNKMIDKEPRNNIKDIYGKGSDGGDGGMSVTISSGD